MRGPYHQLLIEVLLLELARQDITQDSLGNNILDTPQ